MSELQHTTLGILGGGQLGRMFTSAARTMGYDVIVLDPDPTAPAAHFATRHLCAPFDDQAALETMARSCAAISTEFENAPAASMEFLARHCPVRPSANAVAIAQNRIREKTFFRDNGFPVGPFAVARDVDEFHQAVKDVKFPAIIKTAQFGYDGKGQYRVPTPQDALQVLADHPDLLPVVIETQVTLRLEISVLLARGADGQVALWPVAENRHRDGILDITIAPARIREELATRAGKIASEIAERLDYVGVLAVEFFVTGIDTLLVNEIAPRPHNSGHYTLDACITSQFEQQVRTLCGLPLGNPELLRPAVMVNLLGDLWAQGTPPWEVIFQEPDAKLHLYGKQAPRPGRKMGHFTVLGNSASEALEKAQRLRAALGMPD
ncbi:MAG: 5-(carboxyamino)imidazole ribonucleotide synthase [Betaproteobacteria bacterium]|nr:5-(carboxyamino)imidazole ribonucleotide synthase [Betaproteobacteria bacterium]MDE2623446.1 5-(carboxyamino)imidazole ribonucleotide synthase [Betaproteobacteria bacterium]